MVPSIPQGIDKTCLFCHGGINLISPRHKTSKKPRIYVIGYKGLNRLLHTLLPEYSDSADILFIDKLFEEALSTAQSLATDGKADVFISAGANGSYLRDNVDVPVVLIKVGGFDILHALLKARQKSNRIGIVTYKKTSSDLEDVKHLLNLDIEQRSYTAREDAKDCFRELAAKGYKVIVGSSLIVDLAEQEGLVGIFVYSPTSARQAIDEAVQIGKMKIQEEERRDRLNTIIRHLDEGVAAVDTEEQIEIVNPAMERLLGIPSNRIIGRKLSKLSPTLGLEETLKTGTPQLEQSQKFGHRTVVVNRIPIRERGHLTGAVLTFQDSQSILRADRNIRTQIAKINHYSAKHHFDDIVGRSASILKAKSLATKYSRIDSTVLITGETGTGKELIAQSMHNESNRRRNPFLAINCSAFPESLLESELFGYEEGAFTGSRHGGKHGLFEAAHTGTIFLDEVGEIPLSLQTRLLRVLQEKEILRMGSNDPTPIDVRIIAATNRDLKDSIEREMFRSDLFYRLNILRINLEPLRSRLEDLPLLSEYLIENTRRSFKLDYPKDKFLISVLPYFQNYHWPGNIRELENIIERLAVSIIDWTKGDDIDSEHLYSVAPEIFEEKTYGKPVEIKTDDLKNVYRVNELMHIHNIIKECNGNHLEASKRLGVSRTTLWRRLKEKKL